MEVEDCGADFTDCSIELIDRGVQYRSNGVLVAWTCSTPCKLNPVANSCWMTWSWRSRAIRSRSSRTSTSLSFRCCSANSTVTEAMSAIAVSCSISSTPHGRLLRRDAKRTPPPNEVPERGSATTDSSPETFSAGTELPCGAEIGRRLRAASSITVPDRSTADPVAGTGWESAASATWTTGSLPRS